MLKTTRFNAGKVQYDENTQRCTPIPTRGVVVIKPSPEEPEFLSFTWKPKGDATSSVERDELLLIPGDVSFKHVKSCTTGRVFALTFLSSGARHLYWLQDVGDLDRPEVLTEKDLEIVKNINEIIAIKEEEEEKEKEEKEEKEPVPIASLAQVLSPQAVESHLATLSEEAVAEMYGPLLPSSLAPSKHAVLETVRSPFFQQALDSLTSKLEQRTGAGYLIAQSLGVEYEAEGVEGLLRALKKAQKD